MPTASASQLFQPAPPGVSASGAVVPSTASYTLTGTVTLTASATVNGSGTQFTSQLQPNQVVVFALQPTVQYTVLQIISDTQIILTSSYGGTTGTSAVTAIALSWLQSLLNKGAALGLPTSSWISGDPLRTTFSILALELGKEDSLVSQQAQGGFLDFAATGTFTVTDLDPSGNPQTLTLAVSPDPSIPGQNPTGAPTWLDTLASSVYNVTRITATAATNLLYFVNTTGSSLGTYAAGTFHAANTLTGATYTNQSTLTLNPSSLIGTSIASVSYGASVGIITTTAHGLSTGAVVFIKNVAGLSGTQMVGNAGATVGTGGGFATVTVTGANAFTLNGVSGTGTYTGAPLGLVYATLSSTFSADFVGTVGNAGVGQITQAITSIPGGALGNLATFTGTPWQSNVSLAAVCRAKLTALNGNSPKGAYTFWATVASLVLTGQPIDAFGTIVPNPLPANVTLDGGAITRTFPILNTGSGAVQVVVANATGPVDGCINNAITNVTVGVNPTVTTSAPHNMVTNDWCQVNGVQGMTGVNGVFQVTVTGANTFTLNSTSGGGAYTAGSGQVSGGDLYAVEAVLQAYATPNAVTETTISATAVTATITATVYVPQAFVTQYSNALTTALPAYFTAFPIGGLSNIDGTQTNVLPIGAIEGLLYAIGQQNGQIYTDSVFGVLINGSTNDLSLGTTGVAQLGTLAGIIIIGI